MKKYKVLLISLVILGSFLILTEASKAYTCSLSFSSPHSNQIYVGDRVTWNLSTDFNGHQSYWYGTKNGVTDANNMNTGLGSPFNWTTDPYTSDTIGNYVRYVIIRDTNGNLLCQTATVSVSVVSGPTSSPTPPASQITIAAIEGSSSVNVNTNTLYRAYAQSNTQDSYLIYKVNWGDGFVTQNTGPNNSSFGIDFTHQWAYSGIYTITFTASSPTNYSVYKTVTLNVQVSEVAPVGPAVTVLQPNGGEKWVVGQEAKVTWRRNWMPTGANGLVDIFYNTGGLNTFLAGGVNDSYGFTWIVPAWLTTGNSYKIVVTSRGSGGSTTAPLSDDSDAIFSVVKPTASIYNLTNATRNPIFWTGDYARLAVNNLPANKTKTIQLCHSYQETGCYPAQAAIDSNGTWRLEFQVLGISLGDWQRWIMLDGVESNKVSYNVINVPTATTTPSPTSIPTPSPTPTPSVSPTPCVISILCPSATPVPTPTPTPTPTPVSCPTGSTWTGHFDTTKVPPVPICATPTPTPTPTITLPIDQTRLYSLSEIYDGDLIRGQGDIAVWIVKIVGEKRYKRWLFGPQIFNAYGHLGFNKVKNVSKVTLNNFDTSNLIRKFDDAKVYELTDFVPGVRAVRRWIPTLEVFLQRGFDFDSVYIVNQIEFGLYPEGSSL